MPAKKKQNDKSDKPKLPWDQFKLGPRELGLSALLGAVLGLSAPGNHFWFIAWFGIAPLLLIISSSKNPFRAFVLSLCFGTFYNLVSLRWYLGLYPLDWLGFNQWQSWLLAGSALTIVSFHQGLIIAILAAILALIPMTGSFLPRKSSGKWQLPALSTIPLLWVVFINKIGNAPSALGVPWSMIEYSQYQQTQIIQAASIIGGIGIGALIVLVNTNIASLYATYKSKSKFKSLAAKNKSEAIKHLIISMTIVVTIIVLGLWESSKVDVRTSTSLYMLQGNINIEMQKTKKRYSLEELFAHYNGLLGPVKDGLLVWTESSVPVYLSEHRDIVEQLASQAKTKKLDMVIGAMHHDSKKQPFNAAYGISNGGELSGIVYHKRYLVPFGEYAPAIINFFPAAVRKLTNTPAGGGFASGKTAQVLSLSKADVAPLICFECISPELVAASTRAGGQLLVNISDLAWFHESIIGEQMIAFSVFRAIENRRFLAFAANTGPSVVINPRGKVTAQSSIGKAEVITGRVNFLSQKSIFTKWFR